MRNGLVAASHMERIQLKMVKREFKTTPTYLAFCLDYSTCQYLN